MSTGSGPTPADDQTASHPTDTRERAELIAYVEEMVSEAIRRGGVDPLRGLECFLYALDRELVDSLREFAGLSPDQRKRMLSHAEEGRPSEAPGQLVH